MGGGGRFSEFKSKLNQRLLIPYFASNFVWYPIWFIVCHCCGLLIAYNWINHAPLDAFFAVFIGSNRGFGVSLLLFQLWFLPCLFFAELFYLKLYNIFGEKPLYFFSVIVLLSACGYMSIFLPMSFDISLVSLTLILAGNLVRKYNFIDKLNFGTCIIIFIILLAACHFNTFIDMNNRKYGNFVLFYINGIAGSLLVMKISMLATNFKNKFCDLISYCGQKSITILILHPIIIAIMYDLIRLIANENFIRCAFICIPAIVICAVLIPVWIAKNFEDKPVLKYFCK